MFVILIPAALIFLGMGAMFLLGCVALIRKVATSIPVLPHPTHGLTPRETWAIRFGLAGGSLAVFALDGTDYGCPAAYALLGVLFPLVTLAIAATDRPEWFGVLGNLGMALHLLVLNAFGSHPYNPDIVSPDYSMYIWAGLGFFSLGCFLAGPFNADVRHRVQAR